MAQRAYRIISADSHTLEPPDLWEKWLEKKYLDTAPKLVEDKDGGHAWIYMGATTPEPLGLVSCVGTRPEELKWTGARYGKPTNPAAREIHPGLLPRRQAARAHGRATASTPRSCTRRSARC